MNRESQQNKGLLVAFLIIAGLFFSPLYAACAPDLDKHIQKIIDDNLSKYQLLGLQLSILCKDETIPHDFFAGTTQLSGNAQVTGDTLFQIGSITKSFTASLLLQLEAEGVLSINDEIEKWLPQLPAAWKHITIKQLLNHTSGLPDYTHTADFQAAELASSGQRQWTQNELLQFVAADTTTFAAGQGFEYSNTNYVLAGMIIDAVLASQGKDFAYAIKNRLFEPLHLTNTYYLPQAYTQTIFDRMAHGYRRLDDKSFDVTDITAFNMSFTSSAGANISTAHDISLWFQQLMHGKVLPPAQMAEMTNLVGMEKGESVTANGYGLGVYELNNAANNEALWLHNGVTLGYHNGMYWLPCRDVTIAYTSNLSAAIDDISGEMAIILQVISYIQQSDPAKQCQVTPPANALPLTAMRLHF